ncbi:MULTISPECIES: universal stress protein [unclassified Rhizobium]|uniref:universal stress protein n=1 Tax=unclassified Rhizobium TaxID=2613769 RepID=UPI001A97EA70|nr:MULTISPECIES: universal stress protein [unclassified Rhizobium]MBX5165069.1 universal stress protein [Rhizobium sp. NZLR4b]MBX5169108.1 universal stress protein [Rhizobium sp. NZLR1b]MBX5185259.1 universal stress protein [Rhizobium sp. NZLR5]MBX5189046.1 universal stress protein [Rhizobium sp. NZLR3b]MBX5195405.1 universal stress protein [Rhizobium sp. NZLR10]
MYRKIIVAIALGGIEKGGTILRKAASLLDDGGEIVALNVIEDVPTYVAIELPANMVEDAMQDSRDTLKALIAATGIAATVEIRNGPPAKAIISTAESHGADLIIVASHVPDFSNYFIGATADRVVRHAKCSVLVDRQKV